VRPGSAGENVMKRTLILTGSAAFVLMLLTLISAAVAAPESIPLIQSLETEPNGTFDDANPVSVPVSVSGIITPSDDLDFFVLSTDFQREYEASLTIWDNDDLRLRMVLYNANREYVKTSASSASSTSMAWTANQTSHYIRIEAVSVSITRTARYRLDVSRVAVTPTSTDTPEPGSDPYEPNDSKSEAYVFPVVTQANATDANFVPSGTDQDWFKFYVKSGRRYRASTRNLVGVDTYLEVFNQSDSRVADDNDGGGGFASLAEWEASYDGYYYIKVTNQVGTSMGGDTYDLRVEQLDVSATSTPRPASPNPDADRCDRTELGNYDFDHACVISSDVSEQFNFVPPPFGGADNDYFKIWVKPGLLFECGTSNLSAGVDPNLILYDHDRNAIGGNDDIEPGNFNSFLAFYATYEGWMYVLVGTGDRTPSDLSNSNYTLRCDLQVPGEATATPTGEPKLTNTPRPTLGSEPSTATPRSPTATPTPFAGLSIRTLTTPTPVPVTTPAPRFVPIRLLVYYDGNSDQQPGAGEGISGISAQAYEVATNQLLAQGFTDDQGNLEFTVAAQGLVRISVPFFSFSQLVGGEGASIYVRVPPQSLPSGIP
jgi:hypothetical protein